MSAKNDILRVRNTVATQRRAQNIRVLLALFVDREMLFDEICAVLKMAPSGGRKYVRDLEKSGVIDFKSIPNVRSPYTPIRIYKICASDEQLKEFLEMITQAEIEHRPVPVKRSAATTIPSNSQVHVMADDVHYTVRMNRNKVARDPLVEFLFGPPKK